MDKKKLSEAVSATAKKLSACVNCPAKSKSDKRGKLAGQRAIHKILDDLIFVLFPGCHGYDPVEGSSLHESIREKLNSSADKLEKQITEAFRYQCEFEKCTNCGNCRKNAREAVLYLVQSLPEIREILEEDIVAAYEGDPAAKSTMEVIMSYPGVYAVIVHRIAHPLYQKKVPLIPRIMSEYAHSLTGIDIHPGARIGEGFFMDHGTGVVVGETCVIGKHVKLYQGVTLGALSFEKNEDGSVVKGIKRHPQVGDNVVIYSGATILGGDTVIGEHCEIGGNVWLTHSVPPYSKVYNSQPKPIIRQGGKGSREISR